MLFRELYHTRKACCLLFSPAASHAHTRIHAAGLAVEVEAALRAARLRAAHISRVATPTRSLLAGSGGPQAARGSVSRLVCVHQQEQGVELAPCAAWRPGWAARGAVAVRQPLQGCIWRQRGRWRVGAHTCSRKAGGGGSQLGPASTASTLGRFAQSWHSHKYKYKWPRQRGQCYHPNHCDKRTGVPPPGLGHCC